MMSLIILDRLIMLLPAKVEFRIKKSILAVIGFFNFFFFGWGKSGINLGFWETCGKRLPPGIDSPQMSQRKRNNSRQIILTGPLIGLMAWNHSQRFKLNRSQLSQSHNWFTGSTTTTTQQLNLKSQALIVYTEHCMQMAYG